MCDDKYCKQFRNNHAQVADSNPEWAMANRPGSKGIDYGQG